MYRATSSSNCIRSLRLPQSFFAAKKCLGNICFSIFVRGRICNIALFFFPPCFFFSSTFPLPPQKKFTPNESRKRRLCFSQLFLLGLKTRKWTVENLCFLWPQISINECSWTFWGLQNFNLRINCAASINNVTFHCQDCLWNV